MKGINICVMHPGEGGDVWVEKLEDMKKEMVFIFFDQKEETDLPGGLAALEEYFGKKRTKGEKKVFEEGKKKFLEAVAGRAGTFYLWSVEYDVELMFIFDD